MAAQTDTAPNVIDSNGMGKSNGESHICSENEPTAKKMRLCDPDGDNVQPEITPNSISTNGDAAETNGSTPSASPANQQTSVANGSAYHDTSTNHNANTQEPTNQHAQDDSSTNHSAASSETANQSVFARLLANEHALGAVLERLDVTDWLQLELANQEWRKAMLVAWRGRRAVDGYQLFQAVRCQTYGRQLKSFLIPYARTTTERREKLLQLVQFISSRCVSVRSAKRIMSACLVDSSDFCTAQIADEFAKMEHLRVLDFRIAYNGNDIRKTAPKTAEFTTRLCELANDWLLGETSDTGKEERRSTITLY